MGRISKEECLKRREEIIDVAQALYQEMPFKDINVKEIGNCLSFTRTAIYTYFDNKEEIFLALLEREYLKWEQDLRSILEKETLDTEQFAKEIAVSLEKRLILLKILAVDMASLDAESRIEPLISFKKVYGRSLDLVRQLLEKYFPERSEVDNQHFIFTFFPFLYGVYPYTEVTNKQKLAMAEAEVPYVYMGVSEIIENCILTLMK
ncbi:TetR family transcriptional regulator [Streptococcus gallolyticus]|uniref:TetR family transcriptional regulator n=1 Tax=Streptococcus gallolyticus TaxID=315405 RepID=UPI0008863FF0|nr:TetR family transcriptional regulator [Streptococcus gallolyticus]SDJ85828.1 transcriptional regulator, TetR family [Streptococcus gallolyticus]SDL35532.1 transcriptional regulator, TetR family [Streptococcus gallolyticus]